MALLIARGSPHRPVRTVSCASLLRNLSQASGGPPSAPDTSAAEPIDDPQPRIHSGRLNGVLPTPNEPGEDAKDYESGAGTG
ncbi:hypothetical protein ANO14919_089910 [Xylariales sp. No.14919]|nr:hypothetical protein ANO14919_089910 [Xylariales sp. No.14919]